MRQIGNDQNANYDLTTVKTVFTGTPADTIGQDSLLIVEVEVGDGIDDLDGSADTVIELGIKLDSVLIDGMVQSKTIPTGTDRARFISIQLPVKVGTQVEVTVKSDNVADTDVDVTARVFDVSEEISGSGADEVTITISKDGSPVADADVWITNDSAGSNVVAGTKQTDSNGDVIFLLDHGATYYLFMQKDGCEPIIGQAFVASRD